ncbi:MAG TPA: DinB family protein [Methylomirabilota bacterium]|nr:DinB family protein [Methylomirabilota bacterium]
MTAIDVYRSLLRTAHEALEGTLADVTPAQATWDPPGRAFSIAANYAHVIGSEDLAIQRLLRGADILATSAWAGRTGLSELPPLGPGGDLKTWSRHAKVDLPALACYAQAVYAATDAYLAGAGPDALTRPLDLSKLGLGEQPASFILNALVANAAMHCGEISCLKGIQGQKGYPM